MEKPQANAKLGAAVIGGYLLGRFKKGRSALRLAAYLNGGQTPPEMLIGTGRQGVSKVLANQQAKEIVDNVKGPLAEALQNMLMAQISSRVERLSGNLQQRTSDLNEKAKAIETTASDTAEQGAGKVKETGKGITDRLRRRRGEQAEGEETQEEPQEGEEQPEEGQDEGQEPDEGQEEGQPQEEQESTNA